MHTTPKQVGALAKLCLIGEQISNSNFTSSNNKKWKVYLIEKESVGKERTWECEEKMHKEQELNPKINLRKIVQ
jgi:hypothetical protein